MIRESRIGAPIGAGMAGSYGCEGFATGRRIVSVLFMLPMISISEMKQMLHKAEANTP